MALQSSGNFNISAGSTLTISAIITGAQSIAITGGGITNFSGANTYSGGTTISAGTLNLSGAGALGSTTAALTVNGGTLNFGGTSQTVGALNGTGGTITNTTGSSTFTVGNGNATGSFGGTITVNNNGTLGGTGISTGAVTVASGGTLAPGPIGAAGSAAAVGTLRIGALTLQSGSSAIFDVVTQTNYDKLISTGALNLGGNLTVNVASRQTFTAGQRLNLFMGTSESGTFTGIADNMLVFYNGYAFTADYTATGFDLVAVPEPSTWFAAALTLLSIGYTQRRKLVPALKRFRATALPPG